MRRLLAELCAEGNLAKLESERVLLQGAVDFLSQIQVEVAHIHRQVVIRGQGKLIKPHPFCTVPPRPRLKRRGPRAQGPAAAAMTPSPPRRKKPSAAKAAVRYPMPRPRPEEPRGSCHETVFRVTARYPIRPGPFKAPGGAAHATCPGSAAGPLRRRPPREPAQRPRGHPAVL